MYCGKLGMPEWTTCLSFGSASVDSLAIKSTWLALIFCLGAPDSCYILRLNTFQPKSCLPVVAILNMCKERLDPVRIFKTETKMSSKSTGLCLFAILKWKTAFFASRSVCFNFENIFWVLWKQKCSFCKLQQLFCKIIYNFSFALCILILGTN